uniref:NADH-ubiquinone oxidoreductase chain 6 n=1 Tax=Bromius obscurus TaxID=216246 RepID=A0A343C2B0_9CUCU|nr:NADH dehydrogenase subunit 6 [Bromius obscurus]
MMMLMIPIFILPLMSHPLSMGSILLMQTILVSLITGVMNLTFWFSYIMFLIMIGGMLIMFIYMTSTASNEKFVMKTNNLILGSIFIIILMTMMINKYQTINMTKELMKFELNNNWMFTNVKYYMPNMSMLLISMMIYLLLALVMTVKMTKKESGPLRKK